VAELGLADTNGILNQSWIKPVRTSAGLGWERLYVSTQAERPYRASLHSVRPAGSWPSGHPGLSQRQLAIVREVMEARLAEPIPLADLAAAVSLSVSQFSRRFKASTGQTPHRFLMRVRAETACRLLRSSIMPIAEVAIQCGFSHQEHLTRVLRAQSGTTPAAVRRSA